MSERSEHFRDVMMNALDVYQDIEELGIEIAHLKSLAAWEPDDGEAVTEFDVLAAGGVKDVDGVIRIRDIDLEAFFPFCRNTTSAGHFSVRSMRLPHITTRGDLRRLLKALGWQSKKENSDA